MRQRPYYGSIQPKAPRVKGYTHNTSSSSVLAVGPLSCSITAVRALEWLERHHGRRLPWVLEEKGVGTHRVQSTASTGELKLEVCPYCPSHLLIALHPICIRTPKNIHQNPGRNANTWKWTTHLDIFKLSQFFPHITFHSHGFQAKWARQDLCLENYRNILWNSYT